MARIVIDCRFFGGWSGGLGRYVQELVKNIAPLDRRDQYLLLFTKENWDELPSLPSRRMTKVLVSAPYYSLREQVGLLHQLRVIKPDLVHFTHFNHPIGYRGRFVTNIHDLTLFYYGGRSPAGPLKRWVFTRVIRDAAVRSERIITLSDHTGVEVQKLFGVPNEKLVTIPIAIDEHFDKKVKSQKSKIKNVQEKYAVVGPYLIYVGQFRPHKNLSTLLEAFRLIVAKQPKLRLVLVGGNRPTLGQLADKRLIDALAEQLIVPGFIADEELPYLIAGSEVFVWPSLNEGFGLPPLEAMAVGTPVVSSQASCMPEVLGTAAEYFDPEDSQKMAEKIALLLTDQSLRNTLIARGLKQVTKYSWVDMAAKTLKVYQEVLEHRR